MCTATAPNTGGTDANGTWTPRRSYTEEEKAAMRQSETERLRAAGPNNDRGMFNPEGQAFRNVVVQNSRNETGVREDADRLASASRQGAQASGTAPKRKAAGGTGGDTMITEGLAARKAPATSKPSLLGA